MPAIDVKSLKGITTDSRQVEAGFLFAALPGAKVDGRDFIDAAIDKGAVAVLAQTGTKISRDDVVLIEDENPRRRLGLIAAEFYGVQPATIAAVTGTNGKTSVVTFTEQLWRALGKKAASMGTLSGKLTTLDSVSLHKELAAMAARGVTHLALEASSHGLDQCRLAGVKISAAGFTNLSRDHLDYHGTLESYLAAKALLFSDALSSDGTAVLNADVPEYAMLHDAASGKNEISYGMAGQEIKLLHANPVGHGQDIALELGGKRYDFTLPLVGKFQTMNALCALGLVMAADPDNQTRNEKLITALQNLEGVRGRLQPVAGHPQGAGVYVDYAHTPDALENILAALRPHTKGRLFCVFGCGGDRDKGKRPLMGGIAARLADVAIVTDDNPRSEDPAAIRAEIMVGAPGAQEIGDRRRAIGEAINSLREGDVLAIAGKGHEQGQIFKDRTDPFDDVQVASEFIRKLSKTPAGENNNE